MKKSVFGALAMSCVLAAGMSMPAFAAEPTSKEVPMKTTLSGDPITLEAEVPLAIPFAIQNIVPDQICKDAILPADGTLKIKNNSATSIKLTGVQIAPGSDNADYSTWKLNVMCDPNAPNPAEDSLTCRLGIYNDANENVVPFAMDAFTQETHPQGLDVAYLMIQSEQYSNFKTPMPTNDAFTIKIQDAAVYVTSANSAAKILNSEKNYYNLIFTLSL